MNAASLAPLPVDGPSSASTVERRSGSTRAARARARAPQVAGEPAAAQALDAADAPRRGGQKDHPGRADLLLYLLLAALVAAAWQVSHMGLFKPSDDVSYWIGVAGGSMMLMLFSYPLRKYVRFMQRLGKVKWWFWCTCCSASRGPWLILVHSTFHIGSLNAGVALYSMLIVVGSGVVGRFIYMRVHRGLHGEQTSLRELQPRAGIGREQGPLAAAFRPGKSRPACWTFEQHEMQAEPGWATHLRQVTLLPLQQRITYVPA